MPVYPNALNQFGQAGINLLTDPIYAALLSSAYAYNAADTMRSASAAAEIGTPQQLTSPTLTAGVYNAANPTVPTVASGSTVTAIGIFKRVGADLSTPADDPLIMYVAIPSFPTNGGNITIQWDTGANKIFAI